ncbi:MAG: hypothetical protein RR766_06145 [Longicatena sp.]
MRSGFFNSDITGYTDRGIPIFDRAEDAEFFSKFFKSFIANGIYPNPSSNFQVIVNEGMKIKTLPGICYIEGFFGYEDVERVLTIQASESLDRIDRVVLRLNLATRYIDLYIVKGIASATPVAPALNRPQPNQNGDIYELGIADLFIAKNTTSLTQQRITDTRMNADLCGIVTNTIETVDATTLFIQLKDQVDSNIELIQSAIDETLAGEILNKLIKDKGKLTIPTTAIWVQLTSSTASSEELENDPNLEYPWYTDVLFDCKENERVELQPNIPTSNLGVAPFVYSKDNSLRVYASDDLSGHQLLFIDCNKRKKNSS